jgi:hypothetical protein
MMKNRVSCIVENEINELLLELLLDLGAKGCQD